MKKILKQISILSIALLLSAFCFANIQSVKATTEALPVEIENSIKEELYHLYPDKFPERSINQLTLDEMQTRAGTHSTSVRHGNPVRQAKTYAGLHKNATWAKSGNGIIQVTINKTYSISFSASQSYNKTASVGATISWGNSSSVTHNVQAYKGKVCAVAVFADVTAQEWTTKIYDNYSNQLIATTASTLRTVNRTWLEGVYSGQKVYKFYNVGMTV